MIPLIGPQHPASAAELVRAAKAGLAEKGIAPGEINATGEWPRLSEIKIDLTDAKFSRATRVPICDRNVAASLVIERVAIVAAPLFFESTPLYLDFLAIKVQCGFADDRPGKSVLKFSSIESGSIAIEAQRADLETALKSFAENQLAKHGATIKSVRLEMKDEGPRSLRIRAEISAKSFLMAAQIAITGQLDLDDELTLRVRNLAVTGEGMIANLAAGFLRPRFAEIEKRNFPLAKYSLIGVKPVDVRISGKNALRIEARFAA